MSLHQTQQSTLSCTRPFTNSRARPEDVAKHLHAAQELEANDETCLPGMCRSSGVFHNAMKLVRAFAKNLDSHSSSDLCSSTVAAFLGVTVKKPCLQTLIIASVEDTRASFQLDDASRLQVRTSCEIFSQMLTEASKSRVASQAKVFELTFEIWRCEPFVDQADCLQVRTEDIQISFKINCNAQTKKSEPPKTSNLPFGMKLQRPQRKRKKSQRPQKQPSVPAGLQSGEVATTSDQPGSLSHTGAAQLGGSGSDADDSASSDSEDSEPSDLDANADAQNIDETEPVEPVSETMLAEVLAANAVVDDIASASSSRAQVESIVSTMSAQGSFFSRELGLGAENGLAASGRSKCHVCHALIAKGDVRFQWWWNTKKPNAWLHPYCVISAADNYNLRSSTVSKLEIVARDAEVNLVRVAVSNILERLSM